MALNYNLYAVTIAGLSLLVAGIALGWNLFRDCIDKPRLKLTIHVAEIFIPGRGKQPNVVSVAITNTGRQDIVIKNHGFKSKSGAWILLPDAMALFNNKRLRDHTTTLILRCLTTF